MLEPKYKLGQTVFKSPNSKNQLPYKVIIKSISLSVECNIIYNEYYEENELFTATDWGSIRCKEVKCNCCPLNCLNCYFIFDERIIEEDKTLSNIYERFVAKTGFTIPKLVEILNSPTIKGDDC